MFFLLDACIFTTIDEESRTNIGSSNIFQGCCWGKRQKHSCLWTVWIYLTNYLQNKSNFWAKLVKTLVKFVFHRNNYLIIFFLLDSNADYTLSWPTTVSIIDSSNTKKSMEFFCSWGKSHHIVHPWSNV